jgi:hypothetical protein
MELVIIVMGIGLLGVLAQRFGHDSRDGLHSKEEQLAATGMCWGDPLKSAQRVSPSAAPASHFAEALPNRG